MSMRHPGDTRHSANHHIVHRPHGQKPSATVAIPGIASSFEHPYHSRKAPPKLDEVMDGIFKFLVAAEDFVGSPYWPSAKSGITLDFGYDIGQHSSSAFLNIWSELPKENLGRLEKYAAKGSHPTFGSKAAVEALSDIDISKDVATRATKNLLKTTYNQTCRVFPELPTMPWQVQVALTSIIYNRGDHESHRKDKWTKIGITPWHEMRLIQAAIRVGNLFEVYDQIRFMERIWRGTKIEKGMTLRRESEARLVYQVIGHKYEQYRMDLQDAKIEGFPEPDWHPYMDY